MFYFKQFSLNVKTVLSKAIQFNISTQFSSIWPIDRTQSGATTPGPSGLGSDGSEGVLCILQSSCIIGASPSDCHIQDTHWGCLTSLKRNSQSILQPQLTGQDLNLGHWFYFPWCYTKGTECKIHSYIYNKRHILDIHLSVWSTRYNQRGFSPKRNKWSLCWIYTSK